MKKIIAICTILCCFMFVGCSGQQEATKRLEAEALSFINENVATELLPQMRECGIDDLTAESVLEYSFYDEESKTFRANAHLTNFKSDNSLDRLAENKSELKVGLVKTFEVYKTFGGKTYEMQSGQGETVKVDIHISENSEFSVSNSEGRKYGIKVNPTSNDAEMFEQAQDGVMATPDAMVTGAPKKKKDKASSKKSNVGAGAKSNAMECPFCGIKRRCSICGAESIEYCGDYSHYCNSCWREIQDKGYDYWDDYDDCDVCGDWECDGFCEDYDEDYDD